MPFMLRSLWFEWPFSNLICENIQVLQWVTYYKFDLKISLQVS